MARFSGTILRTPRFYKNGDMIPLDKIGQEIAVGSYIVYGHALGRCAGLKIGKVLKISQKKNYKDEIQFSIRVWGIEDDWNFEEPHISNTSGTLQFPERILVIDESLVPPDIFEILKNITDASKAKDVKHMIPQTWEDRKRRE